MKRHDLLLKLVLLQASLKAHSDAFCDVHGMPASVPLAHPLLVPALLRCAASAAAESLSAAAAHHLHQVDQLAGAGQLVQAQKRMLPHRDL